MDHFSERNYNITVREGKTTDVINDVYTDKSILGIVALTDLNKSFFDRYFISKSLTFTPLASITQLLLLAVFVLALPKTFSKNCSHVLPHNGLKFGTSQDA